MNKNKKEKRSEQQYTKLVNNIIKANPSSANVRKTYYKNSFIYAFAIISIIIIITITILVFLILFKII
ncbi:hypothetical protein [Mycoplasmopsis edwardii]|uniref:Uncharacterized protein n=1 Tax=Mycoplasmopsis edwardii TaxID=53558 RepID=A0ACD4PI60_9BACT|nr:hypothetical protein [Mycoplasmopsis edwardii]WBP84367.1 hypothetical protein Me_995_000350 [Mycoplasmopsis edwardii]